MVFSVRAITFTGVDADAYLAEARTVVRLEHPSVVPVDNVLLLALGAGLLALGAGLLALGAGLRPRRNG